MTLRSWTNGRIAMLVLSLAVAIVPLNAGADIRGGLDAGYSDHFDYDGATLTNNVPVDQSKWQIGPVGVTGQPVPNTWVVGAVQTSSVAEPGAEIKALKQQTTGFGASEPFAMVRGADYDNFALQVRASFVGRSMDSGIGIVFRAPVDPLSGAADPNNYYLFTAAVRRPSSNPDDCTTGRCFFLFKKVGGRFFRSAKADTYLNFVNPDGPAESHVYKVIMSGNRIMCYVDGQLVIDIVDTSGDDISGVNSMPGPMFANGTVGMRTSNTRAWFDDFIVIGDGPTAYEGRAAAMDTYGQVGAGSNGSVFRQTGADTGYQYHDHDYPTGPADGASVQPVSPAAGVVGGAVVTTSGREGTAAASAKLLGFSGVLSQTMPDGTIVDVSIVSDSISSSATATCAATTTATELLNVSYLIVVKNGSGAPLVREGKVTQVNPPPNTVVAYPSASAGYVKITLNAQRVTTDPRRADVAAIRIDFFQTPATVGAGNSTVANTGITTASVQLAHVVAGRLCTPTI